MSIIRRVKEIVHELKTNDKCFEKYKSEDGKCYGLHGGDYLSGDVMYSCLHCKHWEMLLEVQGLKNITNAEEILRKVEANIPKDEMYGWMNAFDFCIFMHRLLVHDGGWVIDTGNYENVNYACAYKLLENIKEHPKEWKELFMVG